MKTLILGIGSGRCGTHSLRTMLNKQHGIAGGISHEHGKTWTSWQLDESYIYRLLANILSRPGKIVGDIGYCHLPNIEKILSLKDRDIMNGVNVKVISLKRNRDLVVKSFMKMTEIPGSNGFNHWTDRSSHYWINGNYVEEGPNGDYRNGQHYEIRFPKYDLPKAEAIGKYYDDYYAEVQRLTMLFPDKIRTFATDVLNNKEDQERMLSFIGIDLKDFVITLNIKEYSLFPKGSK